MYVVEKNHHFMEHVVCLDKFCKMLAEQLVSRIHLLQA
jgi:hypothetical protein